MYFLKSTPQIGEKLVRVGSLDSDLWPSLGARRDIGRMSSKPKLPKAGQLAPKGPSSTRKKRPATPKSANKANDGKPQTISLDSAEDESVSGSTVRDEDEVSAALPVPLSGIPESAEPSDARAAADTAVSAREAALSDAEAALEGAEATLTRREEALLERMRALLPALRAAAQRENELSRAEAAVSSAEEVLAQQVSSRAMPAATGALATSAPEAVATSAPEAAMAPLAPVAPPTPPAPRHLPSQSGSVLATMMGAWRLRLSGERVIARAQQDFDGQSSSALQRAQGSLAMLCETGLRQELEETRRDNHDLRKVRRPRRPRAGISRRSRRTCGSSRSEIGISPGVSRVRGWAVC